MKIIAVTQARYGSTRLPGKVLMKINGKELLAIHIQRAAQSKKINKLIVATTTEPEAAAIEKLAKDNHCGIYRGSINDVLDRYYQAVKEEAPDYVVRITSDCPLVDPKLMDAVIETCINGGFDYCSNTITPTFPDGMDVEVFRFSALEIAWQEANLPSDREHVTPFIRRNSTACSGTRFKSFNYTSATDFSNFRLTVDEAADFKLIDELISAIGDDRNWMDYVQYLNDHTHISAINKHIQRNQVI